MKCRDYESLVQPFLAGKLSDEDAKNFINHVQKCPRCYEELEIYFSVYRGIGYLDGEQMIEDDGFEFDGTTEDLNYMLEQMLCEIERRRMRFQVKVLFTILTIVTTCTLIVFFAAWLYHI